MDGVELRIGLGEVRDILRRAITLVQGFKHLVSDLRIRALRNQTRVVGTHLGKLGLNLLHLLEVRFGLLLVLTAHRLPLGELVVTGVFLRLDVFIVFLNVGGRFCRARFRLRLLNRFGFGSVLFFLGRHPPAPFIHAAKPRVDRRYWSHAL